MKREITLKYAAKCADCGADLKPGERAAWYGKGRVYGRECHGRPDTGRKPGYIGWVATGSDGREYGQNYRGRCEDAPCCGCCF